MLDVDCVEADHGRVETHIGFGDVGPVVVGAGGGEVFFHAVEGFEELCYGFCVCFFCGGEAGAVDAVVNIGINPFV